MALAVQARGNTSSASTSLALAYLSNTTAGNLLVAFIAGSPGNTLTITDSQLNTWTVSVSASNNGKIAAFYLANCPGGALTVTAHAGTSTTIHLQIFEYTNIPTVSPLDASGSLAEAAGTAHTVVTSGSVTQPRETAVAAFLSWSTSNTFTAGTIGGVSSAIEIQQNSSTSDGDASEDALLTAASGTITANITFLTSTQCEAVILVFKTNGGAALTVGEMVAAGAEALENHSFAMAGWQRQNEMFLGDTTHTFVPLLPASTTSGIWYNEHLDHPNVQGWVFHEQQIDEDQSTNFIILPRPAWDTDADQQKAQPPSYGSLGSDSGIDWTQFIILPLRGWDPDVDFQELQAPYQGLPSDQGADWTNFIVLPPFDPLSSLVESEFFTASQLAQAGYVGVPSDAGQDTTQFLIIPQQVQNLDSEHQLPSLPYQGLASDQGQDWTQVVIIPAFDPSISLVAEAMFEAYQMYQLGFQGGFGTETGLDPGSWGNPATNVVVATAVMSYLNRFNPFNF